MYIPNTKTKRSNDNKYGYGNNRTNHDDFSESNRSQHSEKTSPDLTEKNLPENYVDKAEEIMKDVSNQKEKLTTSKIRNILSMISDIYNVEINRTETTLLPESQNRIQMIRVRLAYECGREKSVKIFVEKAHLLNYIKGIHDSRNKFIRFARYMEALVAYHRYFSDNKLQ